MPNQNADQTKPDTENIAAQEWHSYVDPLGSIGEQMAAMIPGKQDPQLRHELYLSLFSGMAAAYLGLFYGDAKHPNFWPNDNSGLNFIGPNPDTIYYLSVIEGTGIYKLSGTRGTVRIVDFGIFNGTLLSEGRKSELSSKANYDIDTLNINDKDGSFEVILSPERPAGYTGDWWHLPADGTTVSIRQVAYDWLNEVDARIAIERLDQPAIRPRLTAEEIQTKLQMIPEWAKTWFEVGVNWIKQARDNGMVNKVDLHFIPDFGGHSRQKYAEGLFELAVDEALIYEAQFPETCRYWGVALYDTLFRSLDYVNRQTHLNGFTGRLDIDGKFRAVICATDPGVPNWLDTAGYQTGFIQGRWYESEEGATPTVRKVKLDELRQHLPDDTPYVTAEERDAAIRLRRKGEQLRRRW